MPEWPAWQLYVEDKATMSDILHGMTIDDCDDAHEVLEAVAIVRAKVRAREERERGRGR